MPWVQTSVIVGSGDSAQYVPGWINTDTGETVAGATPPAAPVTAPSAAPSLWFWMPATQIGTMGDTGPIYSQPGWFDILSGTLVPGTQANPPGPIATAIGLIHSQPLALWGPVFTDAQGNYYGTQINTLGVDGFGNYGVAIPLTGNRPDGQPWTAANIQAEMGATAVAVAQDKAAHANDLKNGLWAPLLAVGIPVAMSLTGMGASLSSSISAAGGTAADQSALLSELAAQDAQQTALDAALSNADIASASGSLIDTQSALQSAAEQAASRASDLASQASDAAASATDATVQDAAQTAQAAAAKLSTAASAASAGATTANASTAASLLSGLKTAAAAASAAGTILAIATGKAGTVPRPVTATYPGAAGQGLTQGANAGIGMNLGPLTGQLAIPLIVLIAIAAIAKGK